MNPTNMYQPLFEPSPFAPTWVQFGVVQVTQQVTQEPTVHQPNLAPDRDAALYTAQSAPNPPRPNIQKTADGKFMKPPGEAGRPNSGGFSLKKALQERGWAPEDVNKFIKDVKQKASAKLDTSLSYKRQDSEAVKDICTYLSSSEKWPVLANYVDCWPVISALKLRLQHTSQASRCMNVRETAAMITPLNDVDVQDALEVAAFLLGSH